MYNFIIIIVIIVISITKKNLFISCTYCFMNFITEYSVNFCLSFSVFLYRTQFLICLIRHLIISPLNCKCVLSLPPHEYANFFKFLIILLNLNSPVPIDHLFHFNSPILLNDISKYLPIGSLNLHF